MAATLAALALAGCIGSGPAASEWQLECNADGSWLQPCVMRALESNGSKAETWVAVDPTDPSTIFVGTKDLDPALSRECAWTSHAVTHDAGRSWREVRIAGTFEERAPGSPWFGWACATDPMFTFSDDGALHVVVEMYGALASAPGVGAAGTMVVLATSRDGGETWPSVEPLIAGDGYATSPDYPRIAADLTSGSVHVSFLDLFAGQRCYLVTVRAGTVSPPIVLATPPDTFGCVGVFASPDGVVTIATTGPSRGLTPPDASIPDSAYHFARSVDDGRTFSDWGKGFTFERTPEAVPGFDHHLGDNFECAYDRSDAPSRGALHCVYVEYSGGDAEVVLRTSLDDGASWGGLRRVSDDGSRHQFMPNIAVAGDGTIHVAFLGSAAAGDPALIHTMHAMSADGGVTWRREQISSVPSDGGRGRHQDGYPWYGDYIGASAVGDDVWFSFPDASATNEPTLAVAHVQR